MRRYLFTLYDITYVPMWCVWLCEVGCVGCGGWWLHASSNHSKLLQSTEIQNSHQLLYCRSFPQGMSPTASSSVAFISHTPQIRSVHSLSPIVHHQHLHRSLATSLSGSRAGAITNNFSTMQINMMSPPAAAVAVLLTPILSLCILILLRVVFPTILKHPWKLPAKGSWRQKRDKKTTVVFAGSFNPPHWGHLVMIKYLAER